MSEPRRELPELGPRGEGWVALQVVLLALVGVAGVFGPRWPGSWDRVTWVLVAVCAAGSAMLLIGGFFLLGAQITPFPKPVEGGELKDGGVYGLVRHPIYGGALLLCLAYAFAASPLALLPTALLALLFEGKRRREEAWLLERHPAYEEYRRRVRRSFIPYVW
jgi:protein-S-isoprenylcysteine O-methyltransferase Ste14